LDHAARVCLTSTKHRQERNWSPGASFSTPATAAGLGGLVVIAALAGWPVRRLSFRIAGLIIGVAGSIGVLASWSRQQPTQHEVQGTVAVVAGWGFRVGESKSFSLLNTAWSRQVRAKMRTVRNCVAHVLANTDTFREAVLTGQFRLSAC